MEKIDLFFCSKPLQYLNARNIPLKENGNKKVLLLCTQFYNGSQFAINIKQNDSHWDEVVSFETILSAYFYIFTHRVNNLYISYDNGTMIGVFYHLKHFNVYVLEEGLGTYFDVYLKKNRIRKFIDRCLGVSPCWGHSAYLKGAYVYYPDLYKNRKKVHYDVMPFVTSFVDAIRTQSNLFFEIASIGHPDFLNIKNCRILVYVTNWHLNKNIIEQIKKSKNDYNKVYIKPHPHITSELEEAPNDIEIIRTNLMIEFIFNKWLDNNNQITVFHEGSSSVFYFNGLIESLDLSDEKDSEYNQLVSSHRI